MNIYLIIFDGCISPRGNVDIKRKKLIHESFRTLNITQIWRLPPI